MMSPLAVEGKPLEVSARLVEGQSISSSTDARS